jgi:transcriptional regulator with XRE-family HTH domain
MKRNNLALASPDLLRRSVELGRAVAQARMARHMTRQDFSERANISPSTLVRIEKGDVSVSFLAWLQAFERAGLIALLQPLADPQNDPVGEVHRQGEARRRVRRKDTDADEFDF